MGGKNYFGNARDNLFFGTSTLATDRPALRCSGFLRIFDVLKVELVRRDLNLDSGSGSKPSSRSSSRSASPASNKKAELLAAEGGSTSGTPTPGTPTIHKSASKYVSSFHAMWKKN